IIAEAMREDKRPLYVLCGAGLTNIAAAYLMEPRIAERITAVVWIGGPEYADLCRNQLQKQREYNQGIDPIASQVVFNHSNLHIWQIPRDVYRQALYSYPELEECIGKSGKTGNYLMERLAVPFKWMHGGLGETYILGDSPLVLVTALQSPWESDPSSCEYVIRKTPFMNDNGFYDENPTGRPIRIFTRIDGRLMFEDLIAKLKQHD
ncbi:MAG: nucleoside hydrolase, partial [Prevotella sp.]|nr:nucleoside hydrolase [Prevotella sp.]